ncbi:Replication factor C (RF-C) subunit [Podila humilis]|nr:Replication factor C (RF-C) subunit [Podila humilis]
MRSQLVLVLLFCTLVMIQAEQSPQNERQQQEQQQQQKTCDDTPVTPADAAPLIKPIELSPKQLQTAQTELRNVMKQLPVQRVEPLIETSSGYCRAFEALCLIACEERLERRRWLTQQQEEQEETTTGKIKSSKCVSPHSQSVFHAGAKCECAGVDMTDRQQQRPSDFVADGLLDGLTSLPVISTFVNIIHIAQTICFYVGFLKVLVDDNSAPAPPPPPPPVPPVPVKTGGGFFGGISDFFGGLFGGSGGGGKKINQPTTPTTTTTISSTGGTKVGLPPTDPASTSNTRTIANDGNTAPTTTPTTTTTTATTTTASSSPTPKKWFFGLFAETDEHGNIIEEQEGGEHGQAAVLGIDRHEVPDSNENGDDELHRLVSHDGRVARIKKKDTRMALWVDKHRPNNLDKLDYHADLSLHLKKLCASGDFPHMLVYGPPGAGKKTRVVAVLRELFGPGAEKIKIDQRIFETPSKRKLELNIVSSNYHLEVNPSDVGIYDRVVIQDLLKEVAQTQQVDVSAQKRFKVVVIHEADLLTREAQAGLRRTMEKYMGNLRIIMCCNTTSKIIGPIQSRCLLVRIGAPTVNEICKVLHKIVKKEYCAPLPDNLAVRLAESSGRNLRRAILMLETAKVQSSPFKDDQPVPHMDWEDFITLTVNQILKVQSPES